MIFPVNKYFPVVGSTVVVGVVTLLFPESAPVTIPFLTSSYAGLGGYTGSVGVENFLNGEGFNMNGWSAEGALAGYMTGGVTSFIPGSSGWAQFARGAAQNGGAHLLTQQFEDETISPGEGAANTVTGGLAGRIAESSFSTNIAGRLLAPVISSAILNGFQNYSLDVANEMIQDVKATAKTIRDDPQLVGRTIYKVLIGAPLGSPMPGD